MASYRSAVRESEPLPALITRVGLPRSDAGTLMVPDELKMSREHGCCVARQPRKLRITWSLAHVRRYDQRPCADPADLLTVPLLQPLRVVVVDRRVAGKWALHGDLYNEACGRRGPEPACRRLAPERALTTRC